LRVTLYRVTVLAVVVAAVAFTASRGPHPRSSFAPQSHPALRGDDVEAEEPDREDEEGDEGEPGRGDLLVRAAVHREAMVASIAGIGRDSWSWLGPGNFGGRVRSIVVDPSRPQTMYVGGVSGGVFKTTNGGRTWAPLDDFMANLCISTLVSPATAPRTLYAGTGEWLGSRFRGAGVFKSVDGGETWSRLSATTSSDWQYVNRLAVDPKVAANLIAATLSGIWRTSNGGSSWTKTSTLQALDVAYDPTDGTKAIAGGSGWAAYSADGGGTWTRAAGISDGGRVELAYAPSDPRVVYASVDENQGTVYRSTDGGQSYQVVNDKTPYLADQGHYDNAIWVDPTNPRVLVVGGIVLWRSTDGGTTLTNIVGRSPVDPQFMHVDEHAVVAAPGYNGRTNRTVYVGNDGGVYKAADIFKASPRRGWQSLNHRLGLTQFHSVAVNERSGTMLGGTQDYANLRYSGNVDAWTMPVHGDGGFVAADQTNPRFFYGESQRGHLFRSADGGKSGQTIFGAPAALAACKAAPYQIPDVCNGHVLYTAPFVLDPSNPNRLLFGGASLWRTNDARTANTATTGPSWAQIEPPASPSSPLITAIAVQDDNPDVVYVGHQTGPIYKSTDATADSPSWTQIGAGTLPKRDVLRITVDPTDASVVYATFGSYARDNVWRSTDGGNSWAPSSGSGVTALPAVPIHTLVVDPLRASWIYVGTEAGIFASEDAGKTWGAPGSGPANVPVEQLVWTNRKLVAATYGRGIFAASVDTRQAAQAGAGAAG
jgi:photosystem II stability/assembly factor-like uncharacterized protein